MKIIAETEEEKKAILAASYYMHQYRVYRENGVVTISCTSLKKQNRDKSYKVLNGELHFFLDADHPVLNYLAHLYTTPGLIEVKK